MRLEKIASILLFYVLIVTIFLTAAYLGSAVTSTIVHMVPLERSHTVVIDAGHGGVDGGAISCSGIPESNLNLEIALRLNDLMHLLGIHTKMIRTADTDIHTQGDTIAAKKISDLKNRVRIVNETEDAVLVSIHQNTFSDSRYSGAQVFYAPRGDGQLLADHLQTAIVETINPGSKRRSKKAEGVYLMEHIEKTGILVECGFLSNHEEEAKLRSPSYQQQIICVIAASVCNFLDR